MFIPAREGKTGSKVNKHQDGLLKSASMKTHRLLHCKNCELQFPNYSQLRLHSKFHILNKALKCGFPKCNKAFNSLKGLNLHLKRHPGYAYYKCKCCNDLFYSLKESRIHYFKVHLIKSKKHAPLSNKDKSNLTYQGRQFDASKKFSPPETKPVFEVEKQENLSSLSPILKASEEVTSNYTANTDESSHYFDLASIIIDASAFKSFNSSNLTSELGKIEVDQILRSFLSEIKV